MGVTKSVVPEDEAERSKLDLLNLAPLDLPNFWSGRFTADNERRHICDFTSSDQILLVQVYGTLKRLFEALKGRHLDLDWLRQTIGAYIQDGHIPTVLSAMKDFGESTIANHLVPGIERTIHDLRGGAFQALSFRLELMSEQAPLSGWQSVYFLLRDHLKIMRNSVCDLDTEGFIADRSKVDHDVQLLVEKWSQPDFSGAARPVEVKLDCEYTGTLCESCLEFSTLDRIIYNLMNNAAKYSNEAAVSFHILPVPVVAPTSVRFIFCNSVDEFQRSTLKKTFGAQLSEIFRGGFTTGGHGVGMRICADFCAQAYGMSEFEQARTGGYFGAAWINNEFATWFHWPIAHGIPEMSRPD